MRYNSQVCCMGEKGVGNFPTDPSEGQEVALAQGPPDGGEGPEGDCLAVAAGVHLLQGFRHLLDGGGEGLHEEVEGGGEVPARGPDHEPIHQKEAQDGKEDLPAPMVARGASARRGDLAPTGGCPWKCGGKILPARPQGLPAIVAPMRHLRGLGLAGGFAILLPWVA